MYDDGLVNVLRCSRFFRLYNVPLLYAGLRSLVLPELRKLTSIEWMNAVLIQYAIKHVTITSPFFEIQSISSQLLSVTLSNADQNIYAIA